MRRLMSDLHMSNNEKGLEHGKGHSIRLLMVVAVHLLVSQELQPQMSTAIPALDQPTHTGHSQLEPMPVE